MGYEQQAPYYNLAPKCDPGCGRTLFTLAQARFPDSADGTYSCACGAVWDVANMIATKRP